jgi:hypothetical protein
VDGLTSRAAIVSRTEGSFSPGFSVPEAIRDSMCPASSSYFFMAPGMGCPGFCAWDQSSEKVQRKTLKTSHLIRCFARQLSLSAAAGRGHTGGPS